MQVINMFKKFLIFLILTLHSFGVLSADYRLELGFPFKDGAFFDVAGRKFAWLEWNHHGELELVVQTDNLGDTILHWAIREKKVALMELLLRYPLFVNMLYVENNSHNTPENLADNLYIKTIIAEFKRRENEIVPLFQAIAIGYKIMSLPIRKAPFFGEKKYDYVIDPNTPDLQSANSIPSPEGSWGDTDTNNWVYRVKDLSNVYHCLDDILSRGTDGSDTLLILDFKTLAHTQFNFNDYAQQLIAETAQKCVQIVIVCEHLDSCWSQLASSGFLRLLHDQRIRLVDVQKLKPEPNGVANKALVIKMFNKDFKCIVFVDNELVNHRILSFYLKDYSLDKNITVNQFLMVPKAYGASR